MKTVKNSRYSISKALFVHMLLALVLALSFLGGLSSAYADAIPGAADGTSCILPDGSAGVLVPYVHTDNKTCCPENSVNSDGRADSVSCLYGKYVNPLIALLAALVGVVVVIGIVLGAIEYMSSNGDPQRAASGKKRITNSLLALVAFLLLYAFLQFLIPGGLLNAR